MSGFLRFIAPLVHPIGFAWVILLAAMLISARRGRWWGATVCATAAAMLWLLSQPPLTTPLLGGLERPWLNHTVADAPTADAAVVLGGGWRPSRGDFAGLDLTEATDRLFAGVELCRSGKARALVVGGDPTGAPEDATPESESIRLWLARWGLAPAEFHTLGPVLTTREEAERCRQLAGKLGWKKVLLVTSALHMRRAVAVFEKAGVAVHPVACDFQVERMGPRPGTWHAFPDEEGLFLFSRWWHEQLGWLAYRWFGYL